MKNNIESLVGEGRGMAFMLSQLRPDNTINNCREFKENSESFDHQWSTLFNHKGSFW
jgi:hypothetical protein